MSNIYNIAINSGILKIGDEIKYELIDGSITTEYSEVDGYVSAPKGTVKAWVNGQLRINLDLRLKIAINALEKIANPTKRDHVHAEKYTEVGCIMNIANEALEEIKNFI